ncbi:MAG: GDP-mannose 4,6-dehydratase [Candidatus Heimdallarchaeota archaeon]|nr:GDP-mannose 4,6-dehydratase [Candidatus Heimdallarchaeota archaeon]
MAEKLLEDGNTVFGIDNFDSHYSRDIKENNIQLLKKFQLFTFFEIDILDINLVNMVPFSDISSIYHLAGTPSVRDSFSNYQGYLRNNVETTLKLLDIIKDYSNKKFIYSSSSSLYNLPNLCEEHPLSNTRNIYAASKLAAEHFITTYARKYHLNITILRLFTVYGKRQRPDMAFQNFIRKIKSNQKIQISNNLETTRDYTHIKDILSALILAENKCEGFNIYNIGSGRAISLMQILKIFEELMNVKISYILTNQEDEHQHTLANISKAKKELDYYPKIRIEDGLKDFIHDFIN